MKKSTIEEFFTFLDKKETRDMPLSLYGNIIKLPERVKRREDLVLFPMDIVNNSFFKIYFPRILEVKGRIAIYTDLFEELPEILTARTVSFSRLNPSHIQPKVIKASRISFDGSTIEVLSSDIEAENFISIQDTKVREITGKIVVDQTFFCGGTPLVERYTKEEI